MADHISKSDNGFQMCADNFVTYASDHLIDLGIELSYMTPISSAHTDFDAK